MIDGRDGRRRRRCRCALLLVSASSALALGTSAAQAAEGPEVAWWWAGRPTASVPTVSPIPAVPPGGLYVSGDPTGPSGVSAVRLVLPKDATAESLTLKVADAVGTPALVACPATTEWAPVHGGAWDERPTPDCAALSSPGKVSDDGGTVTFPLEQFHATAESPLDLVLVPGTGSAEASAPFSVSFLRPDSNAVALRSTPATMGSDDESEVLAPVRPEDGAGLSLAPLEPPLRQGGFAAPVALGGDEPRTSGSTGALTRTLSLSSAGGFAYGVVLLLPIILAVGGGYFARTLSRPVVVRVDA